MKVSPIQTNLYSYSNNKNQNTKNDSTSFGFTVLNEKALVRKLKVQEFLAKFGLKTVSENLRVLVNEIIPKLKANEDDYLISFSLGSSGKHIKASWAKKTTPKDIWIRYGIVLASKKAENAERVASAKEFLNPKNLIKQYLYGDV